MKSIYGYVSCALDKSLKHVLGASYARGSKMNINESQLGRIVSESVKDVIMQKIDAGGLTKDEILSVISGKNAFDVIEAYMHVFSKSAFDEISQERNLDGKIADTLVKTGKDYQRDFFSWLFHLAESLEDVISRDEKTGKWRIRGYHGYWKARYDTKADAEDALKAYHANKH